MKSTLNMFQFFNQFRNKTFFIPLVTQRSYAWDEERVDLFLNLVYEHSLNDTEYYFTTVAVRELDKELEKIGDGGNRIVTFIIVIAALVNFIQRNYEKLAEKYKDEISDIDFDVRTFNDVVLWKDIKNSVPRINLEDEDDMKHLMYCLKDDDRLFKIKKSNIISNYLVAYTFFEDLFLNEKSSVSLFNFVRNGLYRITTIVEECESEDEESELFFLKNANIGVQLQNPEILGNSFHAYIRKFENDEERIKELQKMNRECFIRIKKLFETHGLLPDGFKKSFFTIFSYYIGVNAGKKVLIPYNDVSRRLDKYIKDVLSGKINCHLFNDAESLVKTLSYFVDFSEKMAKKDFHEFKYEEILGDMQLTAPYWILATDLLTNKFSGISDEDKALFFKYGKKLYIIQAIKCAGAHPESLFCNIVSRVLNNAKNNNTSIKEETIKEFRRLQKNALNNDVSFERLKSMIINEGLYKKRGRKGFILMVLDEINEVLDEESHLRPFSIPNNDLTIEHICPQSLHEDHPNLHKLGNLCLLSKKTNSTFSNTANWGTKYGVYVNTPWALNRTISEYKDNFSLEAEFNKRNDLLSSAFAKAMQIGSETVAETETVYV